MGNLSRIERGVARPSLDLLYRLANAMGFSITDIFSVAEQKQLDTEQVALNAIFISLLENDRELLLEFAQLLQQRSSRSLHEVHVSSDSLPTEQQQDVQGAGDTASDS